MNSNQPVFSSGSAAFLGGMGATASYTYTEADGTTIVVMDDNSAYKLDPYTGVLTLDPDLTAMLRQVDASSPGIVQQTIGQSSGLDFNSLLSNLSSVISTLVTANAQRQLLQTNIQRASQGLPPLNAQAYMPGVNVGLAGDTKTMVYIIAAGLGALFIVNSMSKGRR